MKKKLVLLLIITLILVTSGVGETITAISAIQDTTGTGSGDSPLKDQIVTISGVVSAESWAYDGKYFVQDKSAKWSGIYVYDPDHNNAYGDSIQITGLVAEYYGLTQLKEITEYILLDSGKVVVPVEVTSGEIATEGVNAEAYEGVLVKVGQSNITNADLGHGEWSIDDGSGEVRIDDVADYYFNPSNYTDVKSVTGPLMYSYDNTKILPRLAYDIVEGGIYTRLQRVQQVRHSDLLKSLHDADSDASYMLGDTISVTGIVTMPTGLSYAGNGIKFIFQEEEGGPWSSILSYNADSTAYPQLFEGDVIEMTGYIDEYSTGSANMTEFFITSPINILNFGVALPPVDTITTGDLRIPASAEQWGNNMVAVKNAVVMDVDPGYEMFSVDDGTGAVLVDDDSDSLGSYVDPPLGSIFSSISGWVYHHYGSHEDSTTYKLCPLYVEDMVLGSGPPQLQNVARYPSVPQSADAVEVSVDVTTNGTIDNVSILYSVDNNPYQTVVMTTSDDLAYNGSIPAQANGSWVEYFIKAIDTEEQSSMMPADTTSKKYGYSVKDGNLSISDIQYSPWLISDSPFDQCNVSLTGIVTVDTSFKNNYGAYIMQDASGPWNGIVIFGIDEVLTRGDQITVHGKVEEYNADYHFKWDNNTSILVDSFTVLSSGNELPATTEISTGELSENSEQYESVLVTVKNVAVTGVNAYDWSVDDGSGAILIDDDASSIDEWFDSLLVDTGIEFVTGPYVYSFGSYKIEIRDMNDIGMPTSVNVKSAVITEYSLKQNFPNPFNPETKIYFELPKQSKVNICIYNILGQKVRNLELSTFNAGSHILNWNGKDNSGSPVPSGTYILRMKAGNFIDTKKMMLVR